MSFRSKILIPMLILSLVSIADAKGKGSKSGTSSTGSQNKNDVTGTVSSVSDGTLMVQVGKGKNGTPITITTNGSTQVIIDGASGKNLQDLQAGYNVTVTQQDGVAKQIKATTSGKGKAGKKKT